MRSAFAAPQREQSASAEPTRASCRTRVDGPRTNGPAGCPAGPLPFDWRKSLSGRRAPSRHAHSEQAEAEQRKRAWLRDVIRRREAGGVCLRAAQVRPLLEPIVVVVGIIAE